MLRFARSEHEIMDVRALQSGMYQAFEFTMNERVYQFVLQGWSEPFGHVKIWNRGSPNVEISIDGLARSGRTRLLEYEMEVGFCIPPKKFAPRGICSLRIEGAPILLVAEFRKSNVVPISVYLPDGTDLQEIAFFGLSAEKIFRVPNETISNLVQNFKYQLDRKELEEDPIPVAHNPWAELHLHAACQNPNLPWRDRARITEESEVELLEGNRKIRQIQGEHSTLEIQDGDLSLQLEHLGDRIQITRKHPEISGRNVLEFMLDEPVDRSDSFTTLSVTSPSAIQLVLNNNTYLVFYRSIGGIQYVDRIRLVPVEKEPTLELQCVPSKYGKSNLHNIAYIDHDLSYEGFVSKTDL